MNVRDPFGKTKAMRAIANGDEMDVGAPCFFFEIAVLNYLAICTLYARASES